jgi:sugar/nucleoside kinase (ribokinase family)
MSDPSLDERLRAANATPTVTAFPDGSRDVFYHVRACDRGRLTSREAFAEQVSAARAASFELERLAVEPGGHAVNLARQARLLGDDVRLFGHLDDPVFDDLAVDAVSMGQPARVAVHEFDDGDLLFVEGSPDIASWDFATLREAADDLAAAMTADAVCCVNWAGFDGMTEALRRLAELAFDGAWFLVDPGDLTTRGQEHVGEFVAALAALEDSYDVVLAANRAEIEHVADSLDVGASGADLSVEQVRARAGIAGVVIHVADEAVAATESEVLSVPNYRVERQRRRTGGGDRFDAGLVHALAAGWGWRAALELGNRCASFYVERATTGTPVELADFDRPRR